MHRQDEGSGGDTPTDTHSGRRREEIDGRATSGTWKGETAAMMDAGYFKSDRWPLQLRRLTFCSPTMRNKGEAFMSQARNIKTKET